MISANQRRDIILDKVNRSGYVQVAELAKMLEVTTATIRTDLSAMEKEGRLTRVHGSAMSNSSIARERTTGDKSLICSDEKCRIALAALSHIQDGDSIFLAAGSTVAALSENLPPQYRLNIFTPCLQVAAKLASNSNYTVHLFGGVVHCESVSVRGEYSPELMDSMDGVKLFFGADGISPDGSVSCSTIEEALFTRKLMRRASRIILLSDSSKLGRCGSGRICTMAALDLFITDKALPEESCKAFAEQGAEVILA